MSQVPAIELRGITKRFPGVVANDQVTMVVQPGEIHAICGENGAGKSTLMKILYGMLQPDEGEILLHGTPTRFGSPKAAINAGIGMVHQHFMLADNLTVLENVVLGSEPRKGLTIDRSSARADLQALASDYGLDLDANALVERLEVGERQRVEIIKVLYRGAEILILDEPTAVLVPQEVEALFTNLRELQAAGKTIIFIDHKLDEVLAIAERITVLRQGKTIATVDASEVTSGDLAELMVGSELPDPSTEVSTPGAEVLAVRDVSVTGDETTTSLVDVGLRLRAGEIVGIAGVEGNGQGELVELIIGLRSPDQGSVSYNGEDITGWSVRRRREAGIGYVPEDRHRRGLLLSAPLWENDMLGHQTKAPFTRARTWINKRATRSHAEAVIDNFDVRTPDADVAAHALSGGNQQKLIIGRELTAEPELLIAAHPTRGIDVGAQAAVWEELREARTAGLSVLLISADLDELIGLSDRILVMFRGQIAGEADPTTVTPRDLGALMTGAGTPPAVAGTGAGQ